MPKLKDELKRYSQTLDEMSPENLRIGVLGWLQNGGENGGDDYAANELAELLKRKEAKDNGKAV
jgi:hypothetical protein